MAEDKNIFNSDSVEIKELNSNKSKEVKFDWSKLNETNFKKMIRYFDSISIAPVEYLITSLLASLGGATGKNVFFKVTDSMYIHLNIWAVIIGKSTIMRKTTAMNQITNDLKRIDTFQYNEFRRKLDDYNRSMEAAKENKTKLELDKPIREYLTFPNDSTVESLSDILSVSKRGLLTHSEFGSFLLQLNRGYSADAKQFLTNLYDVPASYEISRTTKDNTLLQRPFLSILGASTIDWIKENSNDTDLRSGFLARFIFSIRNTPDKEYIPILRLKQITQQSEYYFNSRDIFDYLVSFNQQAELQIETNATDEHIRYDGESYKELLNSENENELSFKGRLLIYSLKFAGLIALSEKRTIIIQQDIQDSILLTEYYKKNVELLLNSELAETEFTRKEKRVIDFISKKGGEVKRSEISSGLRLSAKELDELEMNLIDKEQITIEEGQHKYNGKRTKVYILN